MLDRAGGFLRLIDGKATGKPAKLNDRQRQALARLVESGPIPAIHGVVRWRRKDLAHWIFEEFRISVDETTVGRELRAVGFRKISARPRHKGQNEFARLEDFPGPTHNLSRARCRCGPCPGQHSPCNGILMKSRPDTRRSRCTHHRPGRMAHHRQARDPIQHHIDVLATKSARAEPRRKHMAVHAR